MTPLMPPVVPLASTCAVTAPSLGYMLRLTDTCVENHAFLTLRTYAASPACHGVKCCSPRLPWFRFHALSSVDLLDLHEIRADKARQQVHHRGPLQVRVGKGQGHFAEPGWCQPQLLQCDLKSGSPAHEFVSS